MNDYFSAKTTANSKGGSKINNNTGPTTTSQSHPNSKTRLGHSLNIYKGMPYDEWVRIRDQFLTTHEMN
jgi:hypothetical protein